MISSTSVLFSFGVYVVFVVCRVAVCCFIGLSCVYVLFLCLFSCLRLCYGLNDSPVCDCVMHVLSLRCSFRFCMMLLVCLCVYGMACVCCLRIEFIGLFCVCCYGMFSSFLFSVCMFRLWCVVLLFVVSLVCRACMCCCCFVFVFLFVMA